MTLEQVDLKHVEQQVSIPKSSRPRYRTILESDLPTTTDLLQQNPKMQDEKPSEPKPKETPSKKPETTITEPQQPAEQTNKPESKKQEPSKPATKKEKSPPATAAPVVEEPKSAPGSRKASVDKAAKDAKAAEVKEQVETTTLTRLNHWNTTMDFVFLLQLRHFFLN